MSVSSTWRALPDPQRRGEIAFELAKSLPYNRRLVIIAVLLAVGFVLQATVDLVVGAALLLAATLFAIVKGFSNVPEGFHGPAEWRGGTREQLANILKIARKSREWDQSGLDITCGTGALALVVAAMAGFGVAAALALNGHEWLATAWALDASVLLLPHWVTGVRRILTNDPLTVKARLLLMIAALWERDRQEGELLCPQMLVRRGPKGEMPCDAKLVLRLEKLGDAFLGMQMQVTLNRVQGHDYPYLYCVLVARTSLRMPDLLKCSPPRTLVVEAKRRDADQMDILVIRQKTTKTSGYHTDDSACRAIFQYALGQCRQLQAASLNQPS